MRHRTKIRLAACLALAALAAIGITVLATPAEARTCPHPVACPAIAKICPSGELACRVSPCSCALVCVPEGVGCNQ